jgi:tRNA threonylcarbamoyl adenosine modification protein YeaZ
VSVRLALDASLRSPSCAISSESGIAFATAVGSPVENYPQVIRDALFQAQLRFEDIDEIVACVGPGSYMGVRTTVATANALALSLGVPVTGVLSVDVLAVTAPRRQKLVVAFPAGRGRWYTASYQWIGDELQRLDSPQLVSDAPSDASYTFDPDSVAFGGTRMDARGVLVVADRQRQLTTQTCVQEIVSHERGGDGAS